MGWGWGWGAKPQENFRTFVCYTTKFLLIFKDFDNGDFEIMDKKYGGSGGWKPQKMFVILESKIFLKKQTKKANQQGGGAKRLSKYHAIIIPVFSYPELRSEKLTPTSMATASLRFAGRPQAPAANR